MRTPPGRISRRLRLLPALVALSMPAHAAAEPPPAPPEIDQATFLGRFARSDARFEALRARAASAEGAVLEAGALANPEASYQREEVFDDGAGRADQFALLSWRLDPSGARGRRVAAARAAREAAGKDADADARELVLAGLAVFHDAAHARLRAQLLAEVRTELAGLVDAVRARQGRGDVSGADLDRALLELGGHDDLMADAALDLAQARSELARLVGEPDGALDAAVTALDLPADPAPVADLLAEARRARPDRQAASARARAAGREASAARRGFIPQLSLTGGFKSSDLGDRTATGYVVAVGLSIPLFDRNQGARVRAESEERQHTATARALDSALGGEVRAARRALSVALARARQHAEERIPRALALVKSVQAAYREGERPLFELLDAYRTARDARLRALELRRAARRAEVELHRATGRTP